VTRRTRLSKPALLLFTVAFLCLQPALPQTLTVLHTFTGGADGGNPYAGLPIDAAGHLYGTAENGGTGYGTVFEVNRARSGWTFAALHKFAGGIDGANPDGGVTIGPNGTLYGVTAYGGGSTNCSGKGCGTVYNLRPPARACSNALCPWTETVVHAFGTQNPQDGIVPTGEVTFDAAGNLYGVTSNGGVEFIGTLFELTLSNGTWTENVLHDFMGGHDGEYPWFNLVFDRSGNLYGTAGGGQDSGGVVYEFSPSESGWVESIVHAFVPFSDGASPAGIIMDSADSLYGGTAMGGQFGSGTLYQLSPSAGNWTFTVLEQVPGGVGCGVSGPLVMDSAGNLFGTTRCGVGGVIFSLSPSNGGWTYTELYHFTGGGDGLGPNGGVVLDADGVLYGTTSNGGGGNRFRGCGVVWELMP
jgi:hypothetical protein